MLFSSSSSRLQKNPNRVTTLSAGITSVAISPIPHARTSGAGRPVRSSSISCRLNASFPVPLTDKAPPHRVVPIPDGSQIGSA